MKSKTFDQSIIDAGDRIIEEAQTTLMSQLEHNKEITLLLCDEVNEEEIIMYLTSQEIRLYEDVCDEDGMIIDSIEVMSKIFESVSIRSKNNEDSYIKLIFSDGMMNLLT